MIPAVLPQLSAASYQRHPLHGESAIWVEKNCYADLWIEVVHALGLEPRAMLGFTIPVDFLGDQWTFFKPSLDDLAELYGLDVQELTVWRPLLDHAIEHLGAGRWVSTEADAFWLPDTAGTDYRRQHTKTTIVLAGIDVLQQRLGYFHNSGYFELTGEDFRQLFRVGAPHDPAFLPLYAELVQVDRIVKRPEDELRILARRYLARHLERRPGSNPIRRFQKRFASDLPFMQQGELAHYHLWAFATIRQLGAAFELAAAHIRWVSAKGHPDAEHAAMQFDGIAQGSKTLILKAARAVNSRRELDASPLFDEMAIAWERGIDTSMRLVAG
jgi:Domain of unknown function (DUF1839)